MVTRMSQMGLELISRSLALTNDVCHAQQPVTLIDARAISNNGLIVANGLDSHGEAHGYLLVPHREHDE